MSVEEGCDIRMSLAKQLWNDTASWLTISIYWDKKRTEIRRQLLA